MLIIVTGRCNKKVVFSDHVKVGIPVWCACVDYAYRTYRPLLFVNDDFFYDFYRRNILDEW